MPAGRPPCRQSGRRRSLGRRQQRVERSLTSLRAGPRQQTTSRDSRPLVRDSRGMSSRTKSALMTTLPVLAWRIASATQDFTTDKARLLAAVDQFTGMRWCPRFVEVDREQQAAENAADRDARREGSERWRACRSSAGVERHVEALAAHSRDSRTAQVAVLSARGSTTHGGRARTGPAQCSDVMAG